MEALRVTCSVHKAARQFAQTFGITSSSLSVIESASNVSTRSCKNSCSADSLNCSDSATSADSSQPRGLALKQSPIHRLNDCGLGF